MESATFGVLEHSQILYSVVPASKSLSESGKYKKKKLRKNYGVIHEGILVSELHRIEEPVLNNSFACITSNFSKGKHKDRMLKNA